MKSVKNIPGSVRQRLLDRARKDRDSVRSERITEDAYYREIRIRFHGNLDKATIHMQVDIGFGDAVHPEPEMHKFPTLLDFPAPFLNCYSRESSISEKLEAMVKLPVPYWRRSNQGRYHWQIGYYRSKTG